MTAVKGMAGEGARSPPDAKRRRLPEGGEAGGPAADGVLRAVTGGLQALCKEHDVAESHGLGHARRVLAHTEKALEAGPPLAPARALAVRLAALLHDADDRKIFKGSTAALPNARKLCREAGVEDAVIEEVVGMIGLVSCSKNGNSVPEDVREKPEWLWPRWADRLEATGEIGVVRCWQYNCETDAPLSCDSTPRPRDEEEVWALATEERFAEYQRPGGSSKSMMDHYYDKLLRVARPDRSAVRNPYLEAEMEKRATPLVDVCLAYGKTGVVPEDLIKDMAARCTSDGGC